MKEVLENQYAIMSALLALMKDAKLGEHHQASALYRRMERTASVLSDGEKA